MFPNVPKLVVRKERRGGAKGRLEARVGFRESGVPGYVEPLDTWADMSHSLLAEEWVEPQPKQLAYFCGVMPNPTAIPPPSDLGFPSSEMERTQAAANRVSEDKLRLPVARGADIRLAMQFRLEYPVRGGHGRRRSAV